jgi:hypothetical protein
MPDHNLGPGMTDNGVVPSAADLVRDLRNPAVRTREITSELLAQRYAMSVFRYLEQTSRGDGQAAEELVRSFFYWLLEGDVLQEYDPARLSFRVFLKALIGRFLRVEHPPAPPVDWEIAVKFPSRAEPSNPGDPDVAFEQAFLQVAVDRAVLRVRSHYQQIRRMAPFLAFEQYYLSQVGPPPTFALVARRLRIKERDVRNYLLEVADAVREEARGDFERDGGGTPPELASLFRK